MAKVKPIVVPGAESRKVEAPKPITFGSAASKKVAPKKKTPAKSKPAEDSKTKPKPEKDRPTPGT